MLRADARPAGDRVRSDPADPAPGQLVVPGDPAAVAAGDAVRDRQTDEIEHPAELLRISAMAQRILYEIRDLPLDVSARQRLVDCHNGAVDELGELISDGLRDEIDRNAIRRLTSDPPASQAELHVALAQLVGWLDGLFHGIQATMLTQQLAAQQQLLRLYQQRDGEQARTADPHGPYL